MTDAATLAFANTQSFEHVVDAVELARRTARRIAEASVIDMGARYELGCALDDARKRFGRADVSAMLALVSTELGVHVSALRRWMRVSCTIPAPEFAQYLSLRTARGATLTWSHLELLAEVTPARARRCVAMQCAETNMSVRALAALVRSRDSFATRETVS
jgi:hypothetical protein